MVQVSWDCSSSYGVVQFLSFFHLFPNSTTGFPTSVQWLGVCILIWLSQLLLGSLRVQPCKESVYKHIKAPAIVSSLVTSPWNESKFGSITGLPFPQTFCHLVPAVLLARKNSLSERLIVGWQTYTSTSCPVYLLEVNFTNSTGSLSPLLYNSSKVSPLKFWESCTSQGYNTWYSVPIQPNPPGYILPSILLAHRASFLSN